MGLNQGAKMRIVEAILANRVNYPSDAKHATALGLSTSVYNNVKKGNIDRQMSDANWLSIAQRLGVKLREEEEWVIVETEAYSFITSQMRACQELSLSANFCDIAGVGKSTAGVSYALNNKNAVYIRGSRAKTKRRLLLQIAQEFGVNTTGTYYMIYDRLVDYLNKEVDHPLVIIDEAGDLNYEAFLEIKSLWNDTEYRCGWYMMGADGFKAKVLRLMQQEKVGFAEMFDRFLEKFSKVSKEGGKEQKEFMLGQCLQVAKANAPEGVDPKRLAVKAMGLRRLRADIIKIRRYGAI